MAARGYEFYLRELKVFPTSDPGMAAAMSVCLEIEKELCKYCLLALRAHLVI